MSHPSVIQHDNKKLQTIASKIKPTTPLEESKLIGLEFLDECIFYRPSTSDTDLKIQQKSANKQSMIRQINESTKSTKIQQLLYNILLSGEGMKVVK
jgi:hypothetical protein